MACPAGLSGLGNYSYMGLTIAHLSKNRGNHVRPVRGTISREPLFVPSPRNNHGQGLGKTWQAKLDELMVSAFVQSRSHSPLVWAPTSESLDAHYKTHEEEQERQHQKEPNIQRRFYDPVVWAPNTELL